MSFTSAAHTGATEMELIVNQLVQTELLENTVILNSVTDHSDKIVDGIKSLEVMRFEADKTPGSGRLGAPSDMNQDGVTPAPFQTAVLTTDRIDLNKHKILPYRVQDTVAMQSRANLSAELASKAGKEFAIYMDEEIRDVLRTLTASITMSGPGATMALTDITEARKQLNDENVPQANRILLISTKQEKSMLNIENFIHADKYGAREALLNGEIGQVFGFRVLVSNLLDDDESFAYHRECVGYAIQKNIDFETDRPSVALRVTDYSYAATWGCTLMYDGKKGVKFSNV
jgi:hypothetical protein